ncbi:MAG: acyl-CoA desaturase [Actinobacteria bacterium]|nr:acyl-CoA desaturase [Actinomycetota bacterium]
MTERQEKIQRIVIIVLTVLPLAGFAFAVVNFWGAGLSVTDAVIALFFYLFTGFGVTVGYHRLFTHQSFVARRPLKIALAIAGSMSVQGAIIDWVGTHRRHHAFSDRAGDPHSPHLDDDDTIKGTIRGLWHAHIGWLSAPELTDNHRWAPDLVADADIMRVHKRFGTLTFLSFALPAVLGGLVTWSFEGAVTAFLWGSLARIFVLHHVTWSINSICHFFGDRPFRSNDRSTNNWLLAIISFGESWHNGHHAFPTSAVHGIGRGQIDPTAAMIRLFEKMKLASRVKLVTPKQVAQKTVEEIKPRAWVRKRWSNV